MQGVIDIAAKHFLEFIAMTPSLQNNSTAKLSSITRSGGGRWCGSRSDRGSGMPAESDVQALMSSIDNKYVRWSKREYLPTADYKNMSNSQQQAVYRLRDERYVCSRPVARDSTHKEHANLKRQVTALSKKLDELIMMEEPSG